MNIQRVKIKEKRNSNAIMTFYDEKRNRLFEQRSFKLIQNVKNR